MISKETLELLNQKRKKVFTVNAICIAIMILGVLLFFVMPMVTFVIIIITSLAMGALSGVNEYKLMYKTLLVEDIYKQHFEDVSFNFESGYDKEYVANTQLISVGNRYSSDDYISGIYQGVRFTRSDVHMQNVQRSGKTTTTVTYFEGPWMVFDCPKSFTSSTKVAEKEFLNGGHPGWFSGFEEIKTESIKFNELFGVYTTNEHDAFYLLTPHFMEKLIELERKFEGKLTVGFINSQIHVLIYNNENALEPSIMNPISEHDAGYIEYQANIIKEICTCLNLEREEM